MVQFFIAFLLTSAAALDIPYDDKDFTCIDKNLATKYAQDFHIRLPSFGGLELCNPSVDSKKLFNDLSIVENGQFSGFGNNILIKNFVPADSYYSWLKSQTASIKRGNDIPFATAYNSNGHFTMQDGWAKLSTLGRVGTVIHEARHTAGYRHTPCRQGTYNNTNLDACDSNYQDGGSHAVEMEYYARVSVLGSNFHPVYQSMARLMAMARANFVFNQPVLKKREAIFALSGHTLSPYLIDGDQVIPRQSTGSSGTLKRTSFGASLFNGSSATAFEVYKDTGFKTNLEDFYSYFKLLLMPSQEQIIDMEEIDIGPTRYVAVLSAQNKISTYNFPSGRWNQFVSVPFPVARLVNHLPHKNEGLWLISKDAHIYPFNLQTGKIEAALSETWNPEVVSYAHSSNGDQLMLKTDGIIYQLSGSKPAPWGSGQSLPAIEQFVSIPLYDSFIVQ